MTVWSTANTESPQTLEIMHISRPLSHADVGQGRCTNRAAGEAEA